MKQFQTFHLYTDETIDSPFVQRFVARMKSCLNWEHPEEESRQEGYLDEWAEEVVCLVHSDDAHRILLHCGTKPICNRYRKQTH